MNLPGRSREQNAGLNMSQFLTDTDPSALHLASAGRSFGNGGHIPRIGRFAAQIQRFVVGRSPEGSHFARSFSVQWISANCCQQSIELLRK